MKLIQTSKKYLKYESLPIDRSFPPFLYKFLVDNYIYSMTLEREKDILHEYYSFDTDLR
jgi:hypothetical protein